LLQQLTKASAKRNDEGVIKLPHQSTSLVMGMNRKSTKLFVGLGLANLY